MTQTDEERKAKQKEYVKKYHRKKGVCPNCLREYLVLTNWHDKSDWCPYCLDEDFD